MEIRDEQNKLRMNCSSHLHVHMHVQTCACAHACIHTHTYLGGLGEPASGSVHQEQIRVKVTFAGGMSFPVVGWEIVLRVSPEKYATLMWLHAS